MTTDPNSLAEKEKRRASLLSTLIVLGLIVLKVAVAVITGSLGILAQAADSVLDLVASILAFWAVRAAEQPPDEVHPYGHGKVENLAALAETFLLLVTCGWIVYEAIQRLFVDAVPIESDVWGIAVMILSIVVSIWLSRYLMGVARRHRSQSLEGNALNFRADVLSSSVVLLGLVLVGLGQVLGPKWAWLEKADAVAALIVALFVLRVSLQLGWRSANELLDTAPPGLAQRIAAQAQAIPGVRSVGPVRVRRSGAAYFVDLTVAVARSATLEESHNIATAVERRISTLVHEGDVVVHVDPVRQIDESLAQTVGTIAARFGLQAHNVHAHEVGQQTSVDLEVEVPPGLTLSQAHDRISQMEAAVREELPIITGIHTRIEPVTVPVATAPEPGGDEVLRARIVEIVEGVGGLYGCHNLNIRPGPDGCDVVLHCLADPNLPVAEAHRLAGLAEKQLHADLPRVSQVLIHLEPDRARDVKGANAEAGDE